jgi:hypothetical protein
MTGNEQLDEILRGWAAKSKGFQTFLSENEKKICSKFTEAITRDDKVDVLAELEYASRLVSDARFTLRYEPCGSAGPDFLVLAADLQEFHLEVKRIRETEGMHKFQRFEQAIHEAAREIPSSLGISVCILSDSPIELGRRLAAATPLAIARSTQALRDLENDKSLLPGQERTIPIDGFEEEEISIKIVRLGGKDPTTPTLPLRDVSTVAFTQQEYRKFGDLVVGCLSQLRPGRANVLAVKIESSTHDPADLIQSLVELEQLALTRQEEFFRRKRLAGSQEFYERFEALSAVVVKTIWSPCDGQVVHNLVWPNPRAAIRLKDGVIQRLRSL